MIRLLLLLPWLLAAGALRAADNRGAQFIGFADFSKFERAGAALVSPILYPAIAWDELVVSWNLRGAGQIEIEARVLFSDAATPYYRLAVWSARARHSITNQADEFGAVALDTLMMKRSGGRAQARITLTGAAPQDLRCLAFSFADTKARPSPLPPNRAAWRKTLDVPIRSQTEFREGGKWCSPAGYSMILEYWARRLQRPELNLTVPEAASRVSNPNWPGSGHWTFNTAAAGHFPGIRAYVARLSDISELEEWTLAGIPVAASVSYNRLKGENKGGDGHLIVCAGFNRFGDLIANDPGAQRDRVRRTYPRERFRAAWAESHNTVYLIYPEGAKIPEAKMAHWE